MNQLVKIPARLPMPQGAGVTPEQWRVLTDVVFPSAKTAEAIMLAMQYCAARKLDVFKRPVHVVPVYNSTLKKEVETIWPGINEIQTTAHRTGKFAGMDQPVWGATKTRVFTGERGQQGSKERFTAKVEYPEFCEITVYRMIEGQRCGFSVPVFWEEAYAAQSRWHDMPNEMWRKRPRGQLHKCAMAASLRAAFPEECGEYSAEEMEGKTVQAGGVVIEAQAEPEPEVEVQPQDFATEATEALENEPNVQKWLKLLEQFGDRVETTDHVAALGGLPSVRNGRLNAPTAIKGIIDDILRKAAMRVAPQEEQVSGHGAAVSPSGDPANVAPSSSEPGSGQTSPIQAAWDLFLSVAEAAMESFGDAREIDEWRKGSANEIDRMRKEAPDHYARLIEIMDERRIALGS